MSDGDELHALVADLAEKIRNPETTPESAPGYAFLTDAVLRIAGPQSGDDVTSLQNTIEQLLSIDPAAEVFQKIADAYWNARDYQRVAAILTHIQAKGVKAHTLDARAQLADVVRQFVTPERLNILLFDFVGGALDPQVASRFWNFVPDDVIWPILLDAWSRLPAGDTRNFVLATLRRRLATNLDLLPQALKSSDPARVRAALALASTSE